jgi:hypothetical protein
METQFMETQYMETQFMEMQFMEMQFMETMWRRCGRRGGDAVETQNLETQNLETMWRRCGGRGEDAVETQNIASLRIDAIDDTIDDHSIVQRRDAIFCVSMDCVSTASLRASVTASPRNKTKTTQQKQQQQILTVLYGHKFFKDYEV